MTATRTIIIGRVLTPYYVRARHCGFPGGYLIFWRGKKDFSQPTEFLTWEELLAAIRHRLALAGLVLVAVPDQPQLYRTESLRVRVARQQFKLRKRAYEQETKIQTNAGAKTQPAIAAAGGGAIETAGQGAGAASANESGSGTFNVQRPTSNTQGGGGGDDGGRGRQVVETI